MACLELEQYEPLLHKLSNLYYQKVNKTLYEKDDIFNIAYLGLDKATKTYEDDKGKTFLSYAYTMIIREIYTETVGRSSKDIENTQFNNAAKSIYETVSANTDNLEIIDTIVGDVHLYENIDHKLYIEAEFKRIIEIMQQVLSVEERKVLINYFCREKTLQQIAEKLDIKSEKARQLRNNALTKLRRVPYIREKYINEMQEQQEDLYYNTNIECIGYRLELEKRLHKMLTGS